MQYGCRFQAVDLRWGVRGEAALDQQTMKICLEEINRCQKVTPRPNFIVLLGDRYGWCPLPFEIPAAEFEEIERRITNPEDKDLLTAWYRRDDNAVPPVYCLQLRTGEYVELSKWDKIERRLHDILLQAATELNLSENALLKYTASATEQEIVYGALKVPDANEHIFCFFRTIRDLPQDESAKDFVDLNEKGNPDTESRNLLNSLKDRLWSLLPENVYDYKAEWKGKEITTDHIKKLCDDVYNSLSKIILEEVTKIQKVDPLEKEIEDHTVFGEDRGKFFIGRIGFLKTIADYIKGTNCHPLVVYGESGSGKTALMAKAIADCHLENSESVIIFRFIGATPTSSDGRSLLEGLCRQISRLYGADVSNIPADYRDLVQEFPKRLSLAKAQRPLIIFLDALDQLSDTDHVRGLSWLPTDIPENVRIVVSTLPGECLSVLTRRLGYPSPTPLPQGEN
jgi:hypothetical protein